MSSENRIGWGIIGCGVISWKFAEGLTGIDNARLVAAAGRDGRRAADFAGHFGFERSYGSYQELAGDPDIDVIYIGTIHTQHFENAMLCIENGKNVLCEKPFSINAKQTKQLIEAAQKAGVYLMEAMWTRFIPAIRELNKWLNNGTIGQVSSLVGEFGFRPERNPDGRLFNLTLGGGGLLDVGIYPVSFASMVFGSKPESFKSIVEIGPTGVDEKAAVIMDHGDKRFSNLAFSINTPMSNMATICGSKGYIRVGRPFWHPAELTLHLNGEEPKVFKFPYEVEGLNGYSYEAMAVMEDIANGRKENSLMPLSETLEIMQTLDEIRDEWGLKYPGE